MIQKNIDISPISTSRELDLLEATTSSNEKNLLVIIAYIVVVLVKWWGPQENLK